LPERVAAVSFADSFVVSVDYTRVRLGVPLRVVCNCLSKRHCADILGGRRRLLYVGNQGAGSLGEISALETKLRQPKLPQSLQITI